MRNRGRLLLAGLCVVLVIAVVLRNRILPLEGDSKKASPHAGRELKLSGPGPAASKAVDGEGDAPGKGLPRDSELTPERVETFLKELCRRHKSAYAGFD